MPRILAIRLLEVSPEQDDREAIQELRRFLVSHTPASRAPISTHQTVIQRIANPQPERRLGEEDVPLSEAVKLRVPVEDACRDELIEHADDDGRQDREEDIVERQRPRLVCDLARVSVEERVPELRHVECDVLVERVCTANLVSLDVRE